MRSSTDPGRSAIAAGPPTTALGGDEDVFLPPRRLRPALRAHGIDLATVPGAGHLLAEEAPDEIARAARP